MPEELEDTQESMKNQGSNQEQELYLVPILLY